MADEYVCDSPEIRSFIGSVKAAMASSPSIRDRSAAIRPHFSQILANPGWLPEEFRRTLETGGMGKGIANWLLYRDTGGALSFSALVLPPGVATPVHDHLAWGLVGLYEGEQDEEIYETSAPIKPDDQKTELTLVEKKHLNAGSFYELIPPAGDIHRVITTSTGPSISLHLLTNDIGCALRHVFQPETGAVAPFRSNYSNFDCEPVGDS